MKFTIQMSIESTKETPPLVVEILYIASVPSVGSETMKNLDAPREGVHR